MAFGYFTVTGHFDIFGGAPASGTVTIDSTPAVINDTAGKKCVVGPAVVDLDAAGNFSVSLPSNATTGNSTTIKYVVTAQLLRRDDPAPVEFYARPIGSTVDLSELETPMVGVVHPSSSGGIIDFDADYAHSGLTRYFNTHHPEHIAIVDDPVLGSARKVAKFTTLNTDIQPTANPRTQVESPYNLTDGTEGWFGFGILFPSDFPLPYPNAWVAFAEIYGPSFSGSPPWSLAMQAGTSSLIVARGTVPGIPWKMTITRNQWVDFAFHVRMSGNSTIGFLEVWRNIGAGWVQQTFTDSSTRLTFATLDATNNGGPNSTVLQNYRQVDTLDSLSVYFAAHRIGRSLAAVDPHSYG